METNIKTTEQPTPQAFWVLVYEHPSESGGQFKIIGVYTDISTAEDALSRKTAEIRKWFKKEHMYTEHSEGHFFSAWK